jgi:DNA-binding MarR family transcriptional regulator
VSPFDLDRFLPYRLAALASAVSRTLAQVYEQRFGLSIAEWRILANLARAGRLSPGELAERSSLDKPKVTRALVRLEARGLIARTTPAADKRRAVLTLTTGGTALFSEVANLALEWEHRWLDGLSSQARQRLLAELEALGRALSRPDAKADDRGTRPAATPRRSRAGGRRPGSSAGT